MKASASHTNTL